MSPSIIIPRLPPNFTLIVEGPTSFSVSLIGEYIFNPDLWRIRWLTSTSQGIGVTIFGVQYQGDPLTFSVAVDGGQSTPVTLPNATSDDCSKVYWSSGNLPTGTHVLAVNVPAGQGDNFNFRRLLIDEGATAPVPPPTTVSAFVTQTATISVTTTTSSISTVTTTSVSR